MSFPQVVLFHQITKVPSNMSLRLNQVLCFFPHVRVEYDIDGSPAFSTKTLKRAMWLTLAHSVAVFNSKICSCLHVCTFFRCFSFASGFILENHTNSGTCKVTTKMPLSSRSNCLLIWPGAMQ